VQHDMDPVCLHRATKRNSPNPSRPSPKWPCGPQIGASVEAITIRETGEEARTGIVRGAET